MFFNIYESMGEGGIVAAVLLAFGLVFALAALV